MPHFHRTPFPLLVVLCASSALAGPRLLDLPSEHAREGWLVAEGVVRAPVPASTAAELVAIDHRMGRLIDERPSAPRIVFGLVMTVGGGGAFAVSTWFVVTHLSRAALATLVATLFGVPAMVVSLAILMGGLALWIGGMVGQVRVDAQLVELRERRQRLVRDPPAPPPTPQVSGPRATLVIASF